MSPQSQPQPADWLPIKPVIIEDKEEPQPIRIEFPEIAWRGTFANYRAAIAQLAQVTLRSTLGAHTLDELLRHQQLLKDDIRRQLDERTEAWGVEVQNVEIRSIDLDAGIWPMQIVTADLDVDGHADLAVVNETTQNVTVLLGQGDGTFAAHLFGAGFQANSLAVGDLNGDGLPDLAVGNAGAKADAVPGAQDLLTRITHQHDLAFEDVHELVLGAVPVTLARPAAGRQGHQIDAEVTQAARIAQAPPRTRGTGCIERWWIP